MQKRSNLLLLLSHAIGKMTDKGIDFLMIDDSEYMKIMDFDINEIIKIKFEDTEKYENYLSCENIETPKTSFLNENSSIYGRTIASHGIKNKTSFKRVFHNKKRY